MKRLIIRLGTIFPFVWLIGSLAAGASTADSASVVFCSSRDGDNEIYLMDADGTNLQRLTDNTSEESGVACSPDGRRIVFVSDRDGNDEIYIMNIDGTGLERLTNDAGQDLGPSWSRDGSKIAFTSDRDGDTEIYVMDTDGDNVLQLTHNTAIDAFQDFSPDGSKIAFHSGRDGSVDIWVINADGTNPQQLTNVDAGDYMPEWSPDGDEIVFESLRDGPLELYVMNANGSNVHRITYTSVDNHEPDWSPDGSEIVFVSYQGGDYDIMLVNTDGSNLRNLTDHSAMDFAPSWRPVVIDDTNNGGGTGVLTYTHQPDVGPAVHEIYTIHLDGTDNREVGDAPIGLNHQDWSPDGRMFAATGYYGSSTWSIHTLDADGGNLTRLTYVTGVGDNEPSWSPDGTKIAWGRLYLSQGMRGEVWMMDADGSNQHWVGVAGDGVRWSPDGTRLLYHDQRGNYDLFSCAVDGSDEQQLTYIVSDELYPDWSPDGTKILFASNRDGDFEVFVMDVDGSNQRQLTFNNVAEYSPCWSPDGSLIAFDTDVTGGNRWEVFVMDSTGANLRRVTHAPPGYTSINPDWQPADTSLVPVYLKSLFCAREGHSVKVVWEVSDDAVVTDFRLIADRENERRTIEVVSTGPRSFEAIDDDPGSRESGTVVYTLYARADDGGWDLLATEAVEIETPSAGARLLGVYPNPFNPRTTVAFAVDQPQRVQVEIYDTAGQKVATLAGGRYPAGDHRVHWNGRDAAGREVPSGVYFLKFKANKSIESRKLVLVR